MVSSLSIRHTSWRRSFASGTELLLGSLKRLDKETYEAWASQKRENPSLQLLFYSFENDSSRTGVATNVSFYDIEPLQCNPNTKGHAYACTLQ